jgi:hypothetical protein
MITEIISKVQVHQRILMKKFQICKYKIQKISKLTSIENITNKDIVELIRNKLSDKLVIFTLHQANTGIFDTIIDIEKLKGNI